VLSKTKVKHQRKLTAQTINIIVTLRTKKNPGDLGNRRSDRLQIFAAYASSDLALVVNRHWLED
jgi:3-dehydroquinate dehydratase